MAADTPQIDTALEIIMVSSSSILSFLHSQNAKYHTDKTTIRAWIKPNEPAFKISANMILLPSKTSPILTNNSVESDDFNQSGSLKKLPTINGI